MDKEIAARIGRAIEDRVTPGCVVGVVSGNGARMVLPFGRFTYADDSPTVSDDTIYDVASLTKSIPTASLALMLEAAGALRLDEPIAAHLPALRNHHEARIEDLLRYRVGGGRLSALKDKRADELLASVYARGFDGPPGDVRYTNLPALLLGRILEHVGGGSLGALAHEYFFRPLSMRDTSFFPCDIARVAPTEVDEWRGETRGMPHDESAYVLAQAGMASGHAGLFSTVPDLLNFFEALMAGDYGPVLRGASRGLGWQTGGVFLGSRPGSRFGKTGFTGCAIVCEPAQQAALVVLSNRTYPERPATSDAINALRRDLADIVLH